MTRIVVIANHKGGTAKTTTAVNLAASLAAHGQRTLLIDLDPQGDASSWLGNERAPASVVDRGTSLEMLARSSAVKGLDVIPASQTLAEFERSSATFPKASTPLQDCLRPGTQFPWRYVIIDTPPNKGSLTMGALGAADEVLIPVEAHVLALRGVVQVLGTLQHIRDEFNPNLRLLGFVLCRFDKRNRHCIEIRDRLITRFPQLVLDTVIRENVRLAEAPSFGVPIASYASRSAGAEDYSTLASEIMAMPSPHGENS